MTKKIAVYGSYETKDKVRQRYWHRRKDGVKQRYWHTPKNRLKKVVKKGRYEFHGKGKGLFKSIIKAHECLPKGYVHVSAKKFLEKPEKYGVEGKWIEREIESP